MKKKIHLTICLVLSILLFMSNGYCQCLNSAVTEEIAQKRINFFNNKKAKIIKPLPSTNININPITISKTELINVLLAVKAQPKYDGVRVYFILTDDQDDNDHDPNRLTLVFVPTKGDGTFDSNNEEVSKNDSSHAFVVVKGRFRQTNIKYSIDKSVSEWMDRYSSIKQRIQTMFLSMYAINLSETESLWYSRQILVDGPNNCDLLYYLQHKPEVTDIEINFSSWIYDPQNPDDLKYCFKNEIIFKLNSPNKELNKTYFTLGKLEIDKYNDKNKITSTYSDTGLPCPPNKCN